MRRRSPACSSLDGLPLPSWMRILPPSIACLASARVLKKRAAHSHTSRRTPDACGAAVLVRGFSPALAVAAIQARRAAVHDDDGTGVALVAQRRAGRKATGGFRRGCRALARGGGGFDHCPAHFPGRAYFRLFFCAA